LLNPDNDRTQTADTIAFACCCIKTTFGPSSNILLILLTVCCLQAVWGGMSSIGRKHGHGHGAVSGTASSVAFTPVQVTFQSISHSSLFKGIVSRDGHYKDFIILSQFFLCVRRFINFQKFIVLIFFLKV
jgi:hypothetical protein